MKDYFVFRESSNNGWTICPKHEMFGEPRIEGSYGVLACRIMGVSWVDWLKLCRANGATLYGKGHIYVCPVWKTPNRDFLKELNTRTSEIASRIDLTSLSY